MNRRVSMALAAFAVLAIATAAVAQEAAATELSVTEILLGSAVERGVPTTPATSFARTEGSVYCMVRLANPTGAEGTIRVAVEAAGEGPPAERPAAGQSLDFPARARYRTVARFPTNRAAGSYRCVVRTEEGRVLSHLDFQITE